MYAIPSGYYTLNTSAKTITLLTPFNTLTLPSINKIIDITSGEYIYDADKPVYSDPQVSISGSVITYKRGNSITNTDNLRILIDSNSLTGGSA